MQYSGPRCRNPRSATSMAVKYASKSRSSPNQDSVCASDRLKADVGLARAGRNSDPQPGGVFRLWDPKGCWIEGAYVAVVPDQLVAFTWAGSKVYELEQVDRDLHFRVRPPCHRRWTESHASCPIARSTCIGWAGCNRPPKGSRPSPKAPLRRHLFGRDCRASRRHAVLIAISIAQSWSPIPCEFETLVHAITRKLLSKHQFSILRCSGATQAWAEWLRSIGRRLD